MSFQLKDKTKKYLLRALVIAVCIGIIGFLVAAVCNIYIISYADDYMLSFQEATEIGDIDCIIVLGAGVNEDGSMSYVLSERVRVGAELYLAGASEKLLLSGDHSRKDYNEVGTMKEYMVSQNIDSERVFTDHAGFDTYDTMYRARDIFKAKRVLIVTQQFHLSRAVYIARELGLEAFGVACDENQRYFNLFTEIREFCARPKYVWDALIKPEPRFLGEEIPIWGEASASNG